MSFHEEHELFIFLVLISLCILSCIFFPRLYSYAQRENFQIDYDGTTTFLLTESPYRVENIFLIGDKRDINDSRTLNFFRSIFPFAPEKYLTKGKKSNSLGYFPECAVSSKTKKENLFVSLVGYQTLTLIIPRDSPLKEDVSNDVWKGKRICTFRRSSASQTLKTIIFRLGLNVTITEVDSYGDMYNVWKKEEVDGIFLLCSHPNLFVEKFSFQFEVRIFNFYKYFTSDPYRKNLITFYFPSMFRSTIRMYTYRIYMIGKTIPSCSFYMVLYASPKVSDEFVFSFINTLHKNFFYMSTNLPTLSFFSESTMQICPVDMEFHSGAKKYYTEKAVITEYPMNLSQYKTSFYNVHDSTSDREKVLSLVARGNLV
jgi:TRAP-type uncharacterized transport system substrate-binding protein